jgi:hypothetical protein
LSTRHLDRLPPRSAIRRAFVVVASALLFESCGSSSQTITQPSQQRCGISANTETLSFTPDGGTGTVRIAASRECNWTARSDAPWITLSPPLTGQGEGTVSFRVASNADPGVRTGGVSIEDQRLQISQGGRPCVFRLSSEVETVGEGGGDRTVQVEASSSQCTWTATSDEPWIAVVSGGEGSGNGAVTLRVPPSTGGPRAGTVRIAGQAVRVEQGAGPSCGYALSATTFGFGSSGGRGEVSVSASPGCNWTAQSQSEWIAVESGAGGAGAGVVVFRVSATDGAARTGTLVVAGQVVTITQSPGCAYVVEPATYSAPAFASGGVIAVRVSAGCTWSASSSTDWLVIVSGQSGNGSGEVRFNVAPNSGPVRTGQLRIADRTVPVSQASGCGVGVTPPTVSVGPGAGSGAIQVSAGAGCAWSAASGASWIAITAGASGSGTGQVQFSIAPNVGPARSGTITVGGQVVTVTQATGCTYSIAPPSFDAPGLGGSGSTSITTGAGCSWSAASSVDWIVPATGSGTGPGQLAFTVAPNSGPARSGVLTIAGQALTVNQVSPCTWIFAPSSHEFGPEGGSGAILVIVTGLCTWTASSDVPWITITGGSPGTGGGLVQIAVAPLVGPARTGSITIAGQRYTVTQR